MLRSMTGFGKAVAENRLGRIKVEIKSLNYKFFEVVSRLPGNLVIFEDSIREYLQKRVSRGRLNLFLSFDNKGDREDEVFVDKITARQYYNMILALKRSLRLKGDIGVEQLISFPGVITYRPQETNAGKLWPLLEKVLSDATSDLIRSKEREGRMVKRNLRGIIRTAEGSLYKIKQRAPVVVNDYKRRLLKNVKDLSGSKRIFNPERIEEEAAIFARNCDISEEIHRVSSHISGFKKALSNKGEVGRRLDFIAQEMYREVNTIGAKANDFPISKEVIKIKSLIEKVREQAQNVE